MSTSTSTATTKPLPPSELLPPPPKVITGGPTVVQQMDSDTTQFGKLLNIIGGKKKTRRARHRIHRRSRNSRRTKRRSRRHRRHFSYNYRKRKSMRSHRGGTVSQSLSPTLVVSTPPQTYQDTSVPSTKNITVQLASITAQNTANANLDNPQKTS